jgi:uncharacterized protein (TIGR02646 family)
MIHVKRKPDKLDFVTVKKFTTKLEKEYNEAKDHFTNVKKGTFKFECYKNQQIKDKLKTIFNGKCAYCDSNITHITAGDIEHFRPKSAYWWLACDWNNLLFACENCNRTSKNDAFPLLTLTKTACKHDTPETLEKEDKEERLLLNPCVEDPEKFFEYDEKTGFINPKKKQEEDLKNWEMAGKSIEIYKLQRWELVLEREKLLILLFAQLDYAKKEIENYNKRINFTSTTVKEHFEQRVIEERMKEEIKKLLEFNNPTRPYLGIVRQVLRKFFQENGLPLHSSLQFS